jgi:hypothetical protein
MDHQPRRRRARVPRPAEGRQPAVLDPHRPRRPAGLRAHRGRGHRLDRGPGPFHPRGGHLHADHRLQSGRDRALHLPTPQHSRPLRARRAARGAHCHLPQRRRHLHRLFPSHRRAGPLRRRAGDHGPRALDTHRPSRPRAGHGGHLRRRRRRPRPLPARRRHLLPARGPGQRPRPDHHVQPARAARPAGAHGRPRHARHRHLLHARRARPGHALARPAHPHHVRSHRRRRQPRRHADLPHRRGALRRPHPQQRHWRRRGSVDPARRPRAPRALEQRRRPAPVGAPLPGRRRPGRRRHRPEPGRQRRHPHRRRRRHLHVQPRLAGPVAHLRRHQAHGQHDRQPLRPGRRADLPEPRRQLDRPRSRPVAPRRRHLHGGAGRR